MIKDFVDRFDVIAGLSDHTIGSIVPIVAVSLGAKVIEKHFILDKSIGGPDASFSMDEDEFTQMVIAVRLAEKSFGHIDYNLTEKQEQGRDFSRSLYVVEDVKEGELVTEKNVRSIRPGFGLHPKYLNKVLNKKFNGNFEKGTRLKFSYLQ
jgi:pseudaminic acid synthase